MFKPMLAATIKDTAALKFPLLASPKLDGVRCIVDGGVLYSRNQKPIPNKFTQERFSHLPDGIDGELIVGSPTSSTAFRDTTSGVMAVGGEPDVFFYVFDKFPVNNGGFHDRLQALKAAVTLAGTQKVKIVPQKKIHDAFELHAYEQAMLEKGFEGVMLRTEDGLYKQGRSTLREGYLMKLKRFEDSEALVVGFEEKMHNANEKTLESCGKAKRSSHKAGLQGMETLGTLLVQDIKSGVAFGIGSGFTDEDRQRFWNNKQKVIGCIVKYKFFPTGSKDKPRFPVFLGFRDAIDA